jgi:23S rRNA pseudouridine2605 synthase
MRLNRFLARAGLGSRRDVEKYIIDGRVRVNGIVGGLTTTVKPGTDSVLLDSSPVELPPLVYFKYYKPRGVVSTLDDPHAPDNLGRVFIESGIPDGVVPVGRLDRESEGLILLTNDGELVNLLTHPSNEAGKTYRALIDRAPGESDLDRLRNGVDCGDFTGKAEKVSRMGPQPADRENPEAGYWLEIVMVEGRKREIRKMIAVAGYKVSRLVRIAHGPIRTGDLKPGEIKPLDEIEIGALAAVGNKKQKRPGGPGRRSL